jgi:hypothetical protein
MQTSIIVYLEQYLLEPWNQLYDQPAINRGNIDQKKTWKPRKHASFYLILLILSCSLFFQCANAVEGSNLVKITLCLMFSLNSGFAYINNVTSNRPHLFKGLYNDYREVLILNSLVPFVVFWGFKRYESILFVNGSLELKSFLSSFIGGLHINYVVKYGHLDSSMSTLDHVNPAVFAKIAGIIATALTHFYWLLETDLFVYRASAYLAVILFCVCISRTLSSTYYFHWHHYIAGLMLSPLCHANPAWWALLLQGICMSQFVEGLARWSCAPLWHKRKIHG